MDIKIWPANVEKAKEKEHLLMGYGLGRDAKYYLEYCPIDGSGKRVLIAAEIGGTPIIYHDCKSLEKEPKPCWHLGAMSRALPGHVPQTVIIERVNPSPTQIVKDLTEGILGRPGDFELLELVEDDEVTEEAKKLIRPELPKEDNWLNDYNIPTKVLKKILAFRERQRESLTTEQKSRIPKPDYIPSGNELVAATTAMIYGHNGDKWEAPLLIGPKGSGKSTMAETLAAIFMLPVRKIFGGIDINAESLLGARTLVPQEGIDVATEAKLRHACKAAGIEAEHLIQKLRGSQMKVGYEPGILLEAVEKGEMIIVDEVNMLLPEVTSVLHGLLDWQKCLAVPGYGIIKAPGSFRLVGCMNQGYSGTKPVNEAFQDRFRSVKVPHLESTQLAMLIHKETKCSKEVADKLSKLFSELAKGVTNGDYSEKILSIRALFRVAREEMDCRIPLKMAALSVITESLEDTHEIEMTKPVIEACLV